MRLAAHRSARRLLPLLRPRHLFSNRRVHEAARSGFAGGRAVAYDAARPEYTPAAVEWLLGGVLRNHADVASDGEAIRSLNSSSSSSSSASRSVGPRHDVLDLGAGTGKLTRAILQERPGLRVVGVDPETEMCVAYGKALAEAELTADVLQGTAEKIPLLDSSVGCVVAGQSFHWFATNNVLEEISRVLVPGGALGLVWNTRDTRVPWVKALEDVIAPFYDGEGKGIRGSSGSGSSSVPRQQSGEWKKLFEDMASQSDSLTSENSGDHINSNNSPRLFEPLESKTLSKADPVTEDELVDHVLSLSVIAAQGSNVRRDVAARVREILANDPSVEQIGSDQDKSEDARILLPFITELYVTASLKEEAAADAMEEALHSRVDKIASSALHLDDFFGKDEGDADDEDEDDEDFVDYTDDFTGEWNGPTRGGRRPEPTRHGDWHVMGRCTDFS